jgi:hypothetical protein
MFLVVINTNLFSQNFGGGLGVQFYDYEGKTRESLVSLGNFSGPYMEEAEFVKGQAWGVGIFLYYHYPFYHINNSLAIGINPSLAGYFYNEQGEGVEVINTGNTVQGGGSMLAALHIPVYLTIAYGSYTDKDYDSEFGVLTGIGYGYHTFKSDEPIGDKVSQIIPSVFLEIGTSAFGIRGNVSLKSYKSKYETTTGDIPKVNYSNWGIALLAKF